MSDLATTLSSTEPGRAGFLDQVRSEWTKFRSVRSSWVSLLILVVAALGLSALVTELQANHWSQESIIQRASFDPLRFSQAGHFINQFVVGVLGVLVVSAEYTTGSIRGTLSANPRRLTVLAAKAVVLTVILFVVTEVVGFLAFLISQAILAGAGGKELAAGATIRSQAFAAHAPYVTLGSAGVPAALFRAGLFLVLLALVAFGIAWIIRNTTGSIALFVGILLVIPLILALLPDSIANPIQKYLPINLGTAMVSINKTHDGFATGLLGPWASTGVMVLYVVVLIGIGGWLLVKRDA